MQSSPADSPTSWSVDRVDEGRGGRPCHPSSGKAALVQRTYNMHYTHCHKRGKCTHGLAGIRPNFIVRILTQNIFSGIWPKNQSAPQGPINISRVQNKTQNSILTLLGLDLYNFISSKPAACIDAICSIWVPAAFLFPLLVKSHIYQAYIKLPYAPK